VAVKDRLIEYINFKQISKSEFCRSINVSAAFISSMRKSIQPGKIERIALKYEDLNTGWLLTGEGSMIKNTNSLPDMSDKNEIKILTELAQARKEIIDLLKRVDDLEKENEELKEANLGKLTRHVNSG
jgi:hypothetical protein